MRLTATPPCPPPRVGGACPVTLDHPASYLGVDGRHAPSPPVSRRTDRTSACCTLLSPAHYPEGPVHRREGLYYVEFAKDRLMCHDGTGTRSLWTSPGSGPAGLAFLPQGDLLVACYNAHEVLRLRLTPAHTARVAARYAVTRPNDIAVDAQGGAYVTASGEFSTDAPVQGEVYYIPNVGPMRKVAGSIHYSNGIALNRAGTLLYVAEHLCNRVRRYQVPSAGRLSEGFVIHAVLSGHGPAHPHSRTPALLGPDGMHVDDRDNLWVAQFAGGRLLKFAPDGAVSAAICFAGAYANVTNVYSDKAANIYVTLTSDDAINNYPGLVVKLQNIHGSAWVHVSAQGRLSAGR